MDTMFPLSITVQFKVTQNHCLQHTKSESVPHVMNATVPLITLKQHQCSHKIEITKTQRIYLTPVKIFIYCHF